MTFVFTLLGKFFKIKPNPYEKRFDTRHELIDFLKDHENNIYVWNNLFKKRWGAIVFACTATLAYAAITYICLMGCGYLIYYLVHFFFFYNKQQPYIIDLRDYVDKTDPTLFDCLKSINKIAKSAAFARFYRLLQLIFLKKKPQMQLLKAAQTFVISWLLGYSYWSLCVIIDLAINVCAIAEKKNFFKELKTIVATRIHWTYTLSSLNPKELRIYWFENQWVFNPGNLWPKLKLFSIKHQLSADIHVFHTGLGYDIDSADKFTPIFFFTRHPKPWARGLEIVNSTLKNNSQYLITNQLSTTAQIDEIKLPNKILLNCDITSAKKCFLIHKFASFNCAAQEHTILETEHDIKILNKSPLFNILNNCSGDILFTDKAKKNAEAILEEIEQQSQYYQAYQFYFKEQPLSLKQIDLLYPELLKNIPTDSIDWEANN